MTKLFNDKNIYVHAGKEKLNEKLFFFRSKAQKKKKKVAWGRFVQKLFFEYVYISLSFSFVAAMVAVFPLVILTSRYIVNFGRYTYSNSNGRCTPPTQCSRITIIREKKKKKKKRK